MKPPSIMTNLLKKMIQTDRANIGTVADLKNDSMSVLNDPDKYHRMLQMQLERRRRENRAKYLELEDSRQKEAATLFTLEGRGAIDQGAIISSYIQPFS